MRMPFSPVALGVGLAVVACGIGGVLYVQRGAHLELKGSVLKVRTQAADEASAIAVIDFRFANSSDITFEVKEVNVAIVDKDGKTFEGTTISDMDTRRLFEYYPQIGQKFNDVLLMRNKLPPHQSLDRMIAARFEVPEAELQRRKNMTLRIVDLDGATSELHEK